MQQFGLQPGVDIYVQQQFFNLEQSVAEFRRQHTKGIDVMKEKLERMDDRLKRMDDRLERLEGMDNRLQQMFDQLERMSDRFEHKDASSANANGTPNNFKEEVSEVSNGLSPRLQNLADLLLDDWLDYVLR